jgi:hypothetical protein
MMRDKQKTATPPQEGCKRRQSGREGDAVASSCSQHSPRQMNPGRMSGTNGNSCSDVKREGWHKLSNSSTSLLRSTWIMTKNVIHHTLSKMFFLKKRKEGQAFKKAMFATSHKLIRVLFALLTKKIYFEQNCA